ncbi:hypothetical protein D3C73_1564560 [compost metagenome]
MDQKPILKVRMQKQIKVQQEQTKMQKPKKVQAVNSLTHSDFNMRFREAQEAC